MTNTDWESWFVVIRVFRMKNTRTTVGEFFVVSISLCNISQKDEFHWNMLLRGPFEVEKQVIGLFESYNVQH